MDGKAISELYCPALPHYSPRLITHCPCPSALLPLPTNITAPAHPQATTLWPCIRLCSFLNGTLSCLIVVSMHLCFHTYCLVCLSPSSVSLAVLVSHYIFNLIQSKYFGLRDCLWLLLFCLPFGRSVSRSVSPLFASIGHYIKCNSMWLFVFPSVSLPCCSIWATSVGRLHGLVTVMEYDLFIHPVTFRLS